MINPCTESETENTMIFQPKKKQKLSHQLKEEDVVEMTRDVDILALDEEEEAEEAEADAVRVSVAAEHMMLSGYTGFKSYHSVKFKDKASMIQFEMETVSQRLIDKMSDPVDELGTFIQSLSLNHRVSEDDDSALLVNEQRQVWQRSLFENWHTSKQTKSLIPLIRFLCQILCPPDFNHVLPLSLNLKISYFMLIGCERN